MRILVTGASGLLGRATAAALIAGGDEVTVLQRRTAGLPCREVLGTVADETTVRAATTGQDAVLHMAAKVDIVGSWAEYLSANVHGTRSVIDACRASGVPRLVNVSSPSVAHAGRPLVGAGAAAADPRTARGHYARSKAIAERLALRADGPDLAVLSVRPHLIWGPGDTQLVAPILARARAGRLVVIGTGAALIDTTYLDNAVDAMVAAVGAVGRVHGEALVVSNGEPRPVGEILEKVCRAAGLAGPRWRVPRAAAVVAGSAVDSAWSILGRTDQPPITRFLAEQLSTAHWFDQRHTRAVLKWTPKVTLDEGFDALRRSFEGSTSRR